MKKLSRLFRISRFAKSPARIIFLYLLNPGGYGYFNFGCCINVERRSVPAMRRFRKGAKA
jgi:hypothetical protein